MDRVAPIDRMFVSYISLGHAKYAVASPAFMPHGSSYLWDPTVLWLNAISDCLIGLSFYCIPVALIYFIRRNRSLPFNGVFWLFSAFILACGTTHLMEVWNIWHANYLLAGVLTAITAVVSIITAATLLPLVPTLKTVPERIFLEGINSALKEQIAERMRIEQDLRIAQDRLSGILASAMAQVQAANQELETFTYSVSHDLRAPLRHIAGFATLLLEECASQLDSRAQHHLHRIHDGTRKMGQLVDALLSLARLGKQPSHLQVTALNPLVEEVIALLRADWESRAVEWKLAPLPSVVCDATLMKLVFQNLISNALKYSRPRAHPVIEIGAAEINGENVIFVRDNGVGFNMKYSDKLFGVFQRLHGPEEFEGTGVGLAIVHRIITKHGGRIWAEAQPGKGATFYFTLGTPPQTPATRALLPAAVQEHEHA